MASPGGHDAASRPNPIRAIHIHGGTATRVKLSSSHGRKREAKMRIFVAVLASVGLLVTGAVAMSQPNKPTIVLVHGAFADSSSWYGVIAILEKDGYPVIAAANPLRSVKGDADTVRALVVRTAARISESGLPVVGDATI
jgi:pimeloyl-ACP methyl ester carboxylesterase